MRSRSAQSFNAARAMQYTREVVAFGPRPIGSANHKKLENYILGSPEGRQRRRRCLHRRNSRRQVPGTQHHRQVSRHARRHHRHRRPLRHELSAAQYRLRGRQRRRIFHRHPARIGQSAPRQEARRLQRVAAVDRRGRSGKDVERQRQPLRRAPPGRKWQKDGTLKNIKAFLLADMIGDADLNIDRDSNSTPWLEDLVYQAATQLGYQSHFFARTISVEDDHLPFVQRGVPVRRSDRSRLRLRQRLPPHSARHDGQAQPQEYRDRGFGDSGDGAFAG